MRTLAIGADTRAFTTRALRRSRASNVCCATARATGSWRSCCQNELRSLQTRPRLHDALPVLRRAPRERRGWTARVREPRRAQLCRVRQARSFGDRTHGALPSVQPLANNAPSPGHRAGTGRGLPSEAIAGAAPQVSGLRARLRPGVRAVTAVRGTRTELCPLPSRCPHCGKKLPLPSARAERKARVGLPVPCRFCRVDVLEPPAPKTLRSANAAK